MSETTTTTAKPATMGEFLRDYMQAHGFSQAQLSRSLELSPSAVSQWCSDTRMPEPARLDDIAAALSMGRAEAITLHRLAGVGLASVVSDDGEAE